MYNVIDLFAGAGGLSLGFEMTKKFNMVAFVEKNDNAAKTYLENHPSVKRYCDIKRLDFQDILNSVDKIDVVIGGPPCQGFSNANRQKRKIINGNNELVKLYVDAIDKLKPDFTISTKYFNCFISILNPLPQKYNLDYIFSSNDIL
ncbi:DNA cytosine methyltransferase [Clostridioides difficile]|uniref:DNA cytosine methyltransferase n=1 Tax=Clostridioides difficile TaxID=1496 RepID=UPI0020B33B13|nr:DNA cytosine methyltransferase [Clostridioides difficile]